MLNGYEHLLLIEDLDSIPSIHRVAHNLSVYSSSPKGSEAFFRP